ncbi:MAG: pyridoxamine kinase [Clostridia bacterium]|nr:pyridoxamine kinase [Clostridia bacterium]
MKRIVTVQDISCLGKCSLTVALPIISAMGVECAVVPTAVLSTHTMFRGYTFRDLTDDIRPILAHWKKEGIRYDAVYTGYLGSKEQLEIVGEMFDDMKKDGAIAVVDPVMADHGKLYPGFTKEFAAGMAALCGKADVIVPNLTEASFMLDVPYVGDNYDEAYIKDMLKKLCGLGCPSAVITGVSFEKGRLGVMAYDSRTGNYFSYFNTHLPVSYHGTGDIFSSSFLGGLVRGMGMEKALTVAVDYTVECIDLTMKNPESNSYGVDFEAAIPSLVAKL